MFILRYIQSDLDRPQGFKEIRKINTCSGQQCRLWDLYYGEVLKSHSHNSDFPKLPPPSLRVNLLNYVILYYSFLL